MKHLYLMLFIFIAAGMMPLVAGVKTRNAGGKNLPDLQQILNHDGTVKLKAGINGSFDPVGSSDPLGKYLDSQGKLKLPRGFKGNLDPKGWRIDGGLKGAPRFIKSTTSNNPDDPRWDDRFAIGDLDGAVNAIAVMGSNVYVGGEFLIAGNQVANHIAMWDGEKWNALGQGLSGVPNAIALVGDTVYVGGRIDNFTGNAVELWDGHTWQFIGSFDSWVYTIAAFDNGRVYVGGAFTKVYNNPISHNIAKWNGSTWQSVGTGTDGPVLSIALAGGNFEIVVGGGFAQAGGVSNTQGIAKWDDSNTWSAIGTGLTGSVSAIAVSGSTIYAGGGNHIYVWNSSSWSDVNLGGGINYLEAIVISGSTIYVAGIFTQVAGVPANCVVAWDGATTWTALGAGTNFGAVFALGCVGSTLYVGGELLSGGPVISNNIARWDGSWSEVAQTVAPRDGMNGTILAFAVCNSKLYAAGNFTQAGNELANNVACWDGNSWSPLGSGTDASVNALAVSGTTLYVGGGFQHAGGLAIGKLAQWDCINYQWSTVGADQPDGDVTAIATSGTNIYVAGTFAHIGALAANQIARWDQTQWYAMGQGPDGPINALAVSGTSLYAAGAFHQMDIVPANDIAKWDALSGWSALGTGTNNTIYALAVYGGSVYAGGDFTQAGSTGALRVAKWDGDWHTLGSGIGNGKVQSIIASGGTVYAGGQFLPPAGNSIVQFDGAYWNNLGSGTNSGTLSDAYNGVTALAFLGKDLYAGGIFTIAGQKPSAYIGRWENSTPPLSFWARGAGGAVVSSSSSIAVDSYGNSYVTGSFTSPNITFGSITLANKGSDNFFVVKYDQNGTVMWAESFGGTAESYGIGIALDANANVYVTGLFTDANLRIGNKFIINNGDADIFLLKLDTDGNLLWFKNEGGSNRDEAHGITVDRSGNSFITGLFMSPSINFDGIVTITNTGIHNIFVAGFDPDGNVMFATSVAGNGVDVGNSIGVDINSNCYVTGEFNSATATFGPGITLTNAGGYDAFLAKYDGNGNAIWARGINGSGDEWGRSVTIGMNNSCYVAGYFTSPTITIGSTPPLNNPSNTSSFLASYNFNGDAIWSTGTTGLGDVGTLTAPATVTADTLNHIYLTGTFIAPTVTFGSTTLTNQGSLDFYLLRYDYAGNLQSAQSWGGSGADWCEGSVADGWGNCYLVGAFASPTITLGSTTLTSHGYHDLFVMKTGPMAVQSELVLYKAKWNLVSVPAIVKSFQKDSVFRSATSEVYSYHGGYSSQLTLHNGTGYWVKYGGPDSVLFNGQSIIYDSIPVAAGWNMIGTLSSPLPVASVLSGNPGMTASQFFAYDKSYKSTDTLWPGRGYWIKASFDGALILDGSSSAAAKAGSSTLRRLHIIPTGELPPPPPPSDIMEGNAAMNIPKEYALGQNYPNPFNPATRISFDLPEASTVSLTIYNMLGQVVANLVNGQYYKAGRYDLNFDASSYASGVYFYRLIAVGVSNGGQQFSSQKKMLLIK
ncbi:MAG: SBBP repeat-containing protein [Bacteroidota bacterium]